MIQLLILYYLSLKPTHGYEIQKFIGLNKMGEWNNIQSGSIYYAISKLEKDGLIKLVPPAPKGEKSKRVYSITQKGKDRLAAMAMSEMQKPLGSISCEKFLLYPIIANLTKDEISLAIHEHIETLIAKSDDIDKWEKDKESTATTVEKATLSLMKNTVQNQIDWHKSLLDNLDETIAKVENISDLIRTIDFSESNIATLLEI